MAENQTSRPNPRGTDLEMPVFGSRSTLKDQDYLVQDPEDEKGGKSRFLSLMGLALMIGFIIILIASTMTYISWKKQQSHASNVFLVPQSGSGHVKINVDGRIVLNKIENDQIADEFTCVDVTDSEKFDCYPEPNATLDKCVERGCCWKPPSTEKAKDDPEPGEPACYFPSKYRGYEIYLYKESDNGIVAYFRRRFPTGIPKEIQEVKVEVIAIASTKLRIKITDANNARYVTPYPVIPQFPSGTVYERKYTIELGFDGHLFIWRRNSKGDNTIKIVDIRLSTMFFTDQLLQVNIKVPYRGFYGLGEHQDTLFRGRDWKRFLLLNMDRPPEPNKNLYGAHPFYMQVEDDAKAHGVVLVNSNIMEIITQPSPGITFRPLGGIFDFYVVVGDNPADVVKQYTQLIGRPHMPPYWSMGFHLCKYGYNSLENTKKAYQRTIDAKIPFDVQWNDIDYMDRYNDFTYDKKKFADLPKFVDELHKKDMRWVPIMDVGISGSEKRGTYPPYDDGFDMDVLIKNNSGDVLYAKVWNAGNTVFPDFSHPRANEYTALQYQKFYEQIKFDGSWIDMNEPANFFEGSLEGCPKDSLLEHPYYIPGGMGDFVLATKTVCMSALHYSTTHYNLHNIHGLTNGIATNYALKKVLNKRPFVISRSSFLGQGFYTGHWSGDVSSTWTHLKYSIPAALSFGIFGVSMTGSDICGFQENTTVELCARWHSLGAFYPFSRNHNALNTIDQDPAALGKIVENSARTSLTIRYRLLPYLYTLFYRSHVFGETLFRPLFLEFPGDLNTTEIDTTFLWGSSFMVVPVLEEGTKNVNAYIPKDVWYDYHTGRLIPDTGTVLTFMAELDEINLLVRGGYVLPCQKPGLTTTASRKNNFNLLIALKNDQAKGEVFWDDGESIDTFENRKYNLIAFEVSKGNLTSIVAFSGYTTDMLLDSIEVFGVNETPSSVTVNGKEAQIKHHDVNLKVLKANFDAVSLLNKVEILWK